MATRNVPMTRHGLVAALACLLPIAAAGGGEAPVTEADAARIASQLPPVSDADVDRVLRSRVAPDAKALTRPVPRPAPRVEALPVPAVPVSADLGAITRGFEMNEQSVAAARAALVMEPALFIFVSFSIPDATLQRLVDQAERTKATLVLRGPTQSSIKQTVIRVQQLIGKRRVAFQIDPLAFERYGVATVPSFVLVKAGQKTGSCNEAACVQSGGYVAVSGDVSVDYALDYIDRQAPSFGDEVTYFMRRLRG